FEWRILETLYFDFYTRWTYAPSYEFIWFGIRSKFARRNSRKNPTDNKFYSLWHSCKSSKCLLARKHGKRWCFRCNFWSLWVDFSFHSFQNLSDTYAWNDLDATRTVCRD